MNFVHKMCVVVKAIKNLPTFILDYMGYMDGKKVIFETNNGQIMVARGGGSDAG